MAARLPSRSQLHQDLWQHGGVVKGVSTVVRRMSGAQQLRAGVILVVAAPCAVGIRFADAAQ